mgnify:FL=1
MKKLLVLAGFALTMASCTTVTKTATTANVPSSLLSATVADLEVSNDRVTFEYVPSVEVRRGGPANVKRAAEQELLNTKAKGYDLIVEPQYTMYQTSYFIFGKKISKIVVSGRPAKYKNFHSLGDDVWCNPTFRAGYSDNTNKSKRGLLGIFGK